MEDGLDIETLFDSFEATRQSRANDEDDEDDEGVDGVLDAWEHGEVPKPIGYNHNHQGVVSLLLDGTWHVCPGISCKFAKESSDSDHSIVCMLTSQTISQPVESGHEASWTGRSCGSADPDMISGQLSMARSWRFKKDAWKESENAHRLAATISTEEVIFKGDLTPKVVIKRGAPCVDEIDELAVRETKKKKAEKRANNLQELSTRERLRDDAVTVLRKLFAHNSPTAMAAHQRGKAAASSSISAAAAAATAAATVSAAVAAADPRLLNFKFVFSVGLQKYAKTCSVDLVPMQLTTIHDIAIAAAKFVKIKKNSQDGCDAKKRETTICQNYAVLKSCGSMIVSLWSALCLSPYFLQQLTGDSFRPFVAGCVYGLKRGVAMQDGPVLPIIPVLTKYLPTLRSTEVQPTARQLQASSHRGLCSVHRAISSIDGMAQSDEKTRILEKLEITRRLSADLQQMIGGYL